MHLIAVTQIGHAGTPGRVFYERKLAETVCETCVHFDTGPEFVPVLVRQRDHATERQHTQLVTVYDRLLDHIETDDDPSPTYAGETQI